jgi:4-carboxymuconolactone decarboxylase
VIQAALAGTTHVPALSQKTQSIARISALIALDAAVVSYQAAVIDALAAGATSDEIVGVLLAVAALVGRTRVTSAAPALALAMGYDVDAAFERLDGD